MKILSIIVFIFSSIAVTAQLPIDLKTKLTQGTNEVYGSYCGIVGQHPPNRLTIERWIETEEVSLISTWLKSPNVVRQAYAAEALIRMSNNRTVEVLDEEAISLIMELKESEVIIPTCSGCVYSKMTISKVLKDWKFE